MQPRRSERHSRASRCAAVWRIRLAGAPAVAIALEVGPHLSNIGDSSSVPLFGATASIDNVFAPHESRDRYSDHENQGESDTNDESLPASHVN
jgi:hypothetical protein